MSDVQSTRSDRWSAGSLRAAAFDRFGGCAAVLDSDGTIVDTNRAWRLFAHLNDGPNDTTGIGINYLDVCDRAAADGVSRSAEVATGLRHILSGEREHMDLEYPCPSPTEDRWFLLEATALPMRDGAGAVVFHVDITARKQLTDRLVVLADHDALTGLPNRRAAVSFLDDQLALSRASEHSVSVLFIDINEFKSVNDTLGHHVGDELLVKFGMRARRAVRDVDLLCRFGGDELVVICPGLDRTQALALADRLRTVMSTPFQIGDLEVFGRIAVGISESDATSTADTMLRVADKAMYVDKQRARKLSSRKPAPASVNAAPPILSADNRTRAAVALANSNGLVLLLAADGTIQWASPACSELLGVRHEDIVGLNGIDVVHPDDQENAFLAFLSIPNDGDHVKTDFRVIDANGRIRWIEQIATNHLDEPDVRGIVGNLRDITERVNLLERIELDRRRLADAQAAACLGSFEIDLKTGDISRSDELCRILGVPIGSAANASGLDTVHVDDRAKLTAMLSRAIGGQSQGELEYRIIRPDGEVRWVLSQGNLLAAPNDDTIVGTMLDITDRHATDEALAFQATHDWLTKLPNRASFYASLEDALFTVGADAHVMVAVIGIDNFRQVNDVSGTLTGDAVLRAFAARLTKRIEAGDIVGRVRGDEFVVARTDPAANQNASEFAHTLKELANGFFSATEVDLAHQRLSFSVGVTISSPTDTPESMLADADVAMNVAKRNGGDRVVTFDDEARAQSTRRRSITAALPLALERNQLHLEYQPIMDLTSLRTVGFEALLRWTHPELGDIPPDEFIPIAEANMLIVPIGNWVLETAVRQLARWHHEPRVSSKPWMSINLSAQQLSQDHLLTRVSNAINCHQVPATAIHLEITESILMDRVEHALETIAHLQSLGLNISIDDFGTGYSSLSYLSRLTVDTIKIDQSFVGALTGAHGGKSIVGAMITLAKSLSLNVIAEGIETARQLEDLQTLGCSKGQGFLWSQALHPDAALQWMIHDAEQRAPRSPAGAAR